MKLQDCPGHFGHIKLELPVFHIGYQKALVAVLQCICKTCSRVLLPGHERQKLQRQLQHPMIRGDFVRRSLLFKRIQERCKKMRECPHCHSLNGIVRKVGCARIVHEKFREKDTAEHASRLRREFHATFEQARTGMRGLSQRVKDWAGGQRAPAHRAVGRGRGG